MEHIIIIKMENVYLFVEIMPNLINLIDDVIVI